MKFMTRNTSHSTLHIGYKEKYLEEAANTKFLGLQCDNHVNFKNHIEQIIPKVSEACHAIRSMDHISNMNTLKSIYYAYFHSVIKYGIIFWGNCSNSQKIFTLQKKIVRIVAGVKPRTSCRSLFKQLEIQPVPCQYILSLMKCIISNQENFQINSSVCNINSRNKHHFHTKCYSVLLSKCILCGIKVFNSLPQSSRITK